MNSQLESNNGLIGILWLLPLNQCNNPASVYWANKAWQSQYEIRTLYLVIGKIDQNSPHPTGTSRLGAFNSYLLDKYEESLRFDKWARFNQYRTMILQTPQFTRNDNIDFPNSGSESSSVGSFVDQI